MPELPEVETIARALTPCLVGRRIESATVRTPALRWPIPPDLNARVAGSQISAVQRRAKYLLIALTHGQAPPTTLLVHLGMSGVLSLVKAATPLVSHDHVDFALQGGEILRFNDPRRFGALLWSPEAATTVRQRHPLLAHLGPEPLGTHFDASYLAAAAHGRRAPIKVFIMDQSVVVGVGNIYASEALFRAGIHPARAAGRISPKRLGRLVCAIKDTLRDAIAAGGTTLRDYRLPDGEIGAYQEATLVYARDGRPCTQCAKPVSLLRQGGRATYYCARCQR